MDIKDLKKAGVSDAKEINIKEVDIKQKGKETKTEEIKIKREKDREGKNQSKFRVLWEKFWYTIWQDNSLKGWIISVLFIFILIKLIFFPVLGFITGTSLPLAIVESCSMYHEGNMLSDFDSWWGNHEEKYSDFNINESQFQKFSMTKGFNKGDILFVVGADPEKLELGDVIIFNADQRNPVIHRIIGIREVNGKKVFSTIGDNNNGQLGFENNIQESQLIGKASIRALPYLGWVKLIFYEYQKPTQEKGFCHEN